MLKGTYLMILGPFGNGQRNSRGYKLVDLGRTISSKESRQRKWIGLSPMKMELDKLHLDEKEANRIRRRLGSLVSIDSKAFS